MAYVVKLKYKDSDHPMYANLSLIKNIKEIRYGNDYSLDWFSMDLSKARKLYNDLVSRNVASKGYSYQDDKLLQYISIVDLSNYPPYSEFEVVEYREFK